MEWMESSRSSQAWERPAGAGLSQRLEDADVLTCLHTRGGGGPGSSGCAGNREGTEPEPLDAPGEPQALGHRAGTSSLSVSKGLEYKRWMDNMGSARGELALGTVLDSLSRCT